MINLKALALECLECLECRHRIHLFGSSGCKHNIPDTIDIWYHSGLINFIFRRRLYGSDSKGVDESLKNIGRETTAHIRTTNQSRHHVRPLNGK